MLGLVGKTGIDLPNEQDSLVPSTEWKRQRTGEKWYPGETISVSIGQGQVSVTPVSLAVMIATVANGGTRVTPHVVKAVDEATGWKPVPPPRRGRPRRVQARSLAALRDGLWMVVNGAGTGGRARIAGCDVAGKTGTAQVISFRAAGGPRQRPATSATTAGSSSSRPGQSADRRRRSSASTTSTATWARRSPST